MSNFLLPAVLNMSFTGSIVILAVLLARILIRRAPKIFSYLLWSVVLFRLLCPVSVSTQMSLLRFVGNFAGSFAAPAGNIGNLESMLQDFTAGQDFSLPAANADARQFQHTADKEMSGMEKSASAFWLWGTALWLAGMAAVLLYHAVQMLRFRRRLAGAMPLRENIYLADYIASPFVCGVFKPRIYLPSALSKPEQEYIILHEQVHIRRRDYLVKLLSFAALTVHWFNPLVWLAFCLSEKDMEMSCDEAVMKKMNRDIRAEYSASLIKLASGSQITGAFPAFGEGDTRSRIQHVMRYKKPTMTVMIAAAAVVLITIVAACSNPKEQGGSGSDSRNQEQTASSGSKEQEQGGSGSDSRNQEQTASSGSKEQEQGGGSGSFSANRMADILDVFSVENLECAFIRAMADDSLEVDVAEYIELEDTERVKELGLTENEDMPDGYCFHNPDTDTVFWKLDENTEYVFFDWGRDFVDDEATDEIVVRTKDREIFFQYYNINYANIGRMPFFFEVEDGVVKRIVEKFFA